VPLAVLDTSSTPLNPSALPATTVRSLYVHVPFCFHKCHYCDFYSITRQSDERMSGFVDRALREAGMWNATPVSVRPRTIFLGGGTPTLLPIEQMRRLLAGLRERFDLSDVGEWTVEANPATVTSEYCAMLREAGVDRLSFGAQSFDRAELKVLERHHDPDDVPRSLELARAAGLRRLNLDLIFAIPGQTLESWDRSLSAALAPGTSHLSCYGLTYEPNTPIAVRRRLGMLDDVVEESAELEMLRHTRQRLSACGLAPYEISNYALPGDECRHNLVYWTGGDYVALGPSGASHAQGWRWRNRPHLGEWERAVDAATLPAVEVEHLSPRRRAGELAMLLLRLARGLDFADFAARTGFDARRIFAEPIDRFTRVGLLQADEAAVRLTDRGLVVADALSGEFLRPSD
jgi:oxygen-independent coproporphyrinogen-3 oxidase